MNALMEKIIAESTAPAVMGASGHNRFKTVADSAHIAYRCTLTHIGTSAQVLLPDTSVDDRKYTWVISTYIATEKKVQVHQCNEHVAQALKVARDGKYFPTGTVLPLFGPLVPHAQDQAMHTEDRQIDAQKLDRLAILL